MRKILAPTIASILLALPSVAGAETDVGDDRVLSGEIEAGARIVTGKDGSAALNEYERIRTTGIANGWLLLEDDDRMHYLRSTIDFQDEDDQTYTFGFGRYGHYGVELDYMEFPHQYSNRSLTNYMRSGKSFFLPNAWDYADVPTSATTPQNIFKENLRFRELIGGGSAYVRPELGLEFSTSYHIQDRHGDHPFSISTAGFGSFSNFASPIDDTIHTMTGAATLARERWTFAFGYVGSIYDNGLQSEIVANPTNPVDQVGSGAFGRISAAPDNSAHQMSFSSSYVLPTDYPSRVAGTFAYGIRIQDQNFLPYTINTALVTTPLPQNDLDGWVNTFLGNVVYTARPTTEWNVEARYRVYSLDNDSNHMAFTERVPYDNTVQNLAANPLESHANDYTRQNVMLETSYDLSPMATVSTGFGWENWDRSKHREVRHSNDYSGELGLRLRPHEQVDLLTTWTIGYRAYNNYSNLEPGLESDQLRKFDVADRLYEGIRARWTYTPTMELSLALTGGYTDSDYDESSLGLKDDERWNIGLDLDYAPVDWLTLTAWYSYDAIETRQRSINRNSAAQTPATNPDLVWNGKSEDDAHTAGLEVFTRLIPDVLDWRTAYTLQLARAQTHARGGVNSGADLADFPNIRDNLHDVSTELTWHVLEPLDLIGGYRYASFHDQNFRYQFGAPGTNTGDNNLYLNNGVDNYRAHIVTLTARYEF